MQWLVLLCADKCDLMVELQTNIGPDIAQTRSILMQCWRHSQDSTRVDRQTDRISFKRKLMPIRLKYTLKIKCYLIDGSKIDYVCHGHKFKLFFLYIAV